MGLSQRCGQADNEGDLKRVLLDSVHVQLNTSTESQIVTQAIRSVPEDAPIHLLSYLLDYFLLQVQSNDMMYRAPCHASAPCHPPPSSTWHGAQGTHTLHHNLYALAVETCTNLLCGLRRTMSLA